MQMETVKGPDSSQEYLLTKLIDQYQAVLLQMCFMYLHDRTMAEDAVQETFLKAYRSMTAFRGECSEKTWLTRIAINTWNVICQGQIYLKSKPPAKPVVYTVPSRH